MTGKTGQSRFPDNPNREYIRWFKKAYKLTNKSNIEIKELIATLKANEKKQLLEDLNMMFKTNSSDLAIDLNDAE